ncbi:23S rRNA (guanosine(2251)-2'-O)-methyltransferase RlmB [Granulosicoccus antarcticus]|uniref:23S rRNA (guanosine-2'-O-)-methyltransferase RlmB n=1 Tax=Granulosicoccus antarcticus IMCC3135 TaxID=1192854 RepID=A0A2Z2P1F7_9GAMM|nr:23S rRNA (guanosine(2251)-2'-O)-methyltransferase RlmB [Granulosicoccus antarcticus]ASJ75070.1 23S rRNA (guanosine-2'-O-)-methyltransferase RlmB [Granulosicoccus antarcticus IMCC3135]
MNRSYVGGLHSVKAALKSSASEIECLYVQKDRRDTRLRDLQALASKHAIETREVNRSMLNELVSDVQHQGVVALLRTTSSGVREDLQAFVQQLLAGPRTENLLILVLDEVQDPHNLGACLRSADAAGVDAVVVPADNSVGLTPVVRKVASGAAETVPLFQVTNLQRALGELQDAGIWVYGAAGEASESLFELDLTGHVALVMGAEGRGMRRLTRERCDQLYKLPMKGAVSSLNVSVAAGISLFEVVRQRD